MSTPFSAAWRMISAEGLPWTTSSADRDALLPGLRGELGELGLRVAGDLLEHLGHRHREQVARVAHGEVLDHVQQHELGPVLLREGHAVGEGVAGAVREVGGDEDLLDLDHGPPPWLSREGGSQRDPSGRILVPDRGRREGVILGPRRGTVIRGLMLVVQALFWLLVLRFVVRTWLGVPPASGRPAGPRPGPRAQVGAARGPRPRPRLPHLRAALPRPRRARVAGPRGARSAPPPAATRRSPP